MILMLSLLGWINGLSISFIFIFTLSIGLFSIYQSRKTNAKLLLYVGFALIFAGLLWIGNLIDFLTIISSGENADNSMGLIGIACEIWFAPAFIFCIIFVVEILKPKMKSFIICIYIIIGVLYEIFLLLNPTNSLTFIYPDTSGRDLIEDSIVLKSPAGILYLILLMSFVAFNGFGTLIKGIQSREVVRKKFILISIGSFLIIVIGLLDNILQPGFFLISIRLLLIVCYLLFYLGIRKEPIEPKKSSKEEVKIQSGLFRLTERPSQITEEEVSISKEKKICLVCKGKVGGFNFICTECGTFYCKNCINSLINLENACWVCNTPFDKNKPSKPYEKEEDIKLKISEDIEKKIKG